jgi:methyl-accepting chemotaxis protein-3 (ribose and galactose sensor receptor)
VLLKAIKIRTDRANGANRRTTHAAGLMFMVGAFALALVLTAMTFIVLRRTVIHPLQRAAKRIENIAKAT